MHHIAHIRCIMLHTSDALHCPHQMHYVAHVRCITLHTHQMHHIAHTTDASHYTHQMHHIARTSDVSHCTHQMHQIAHIRCIILHTSDASYCTHQARTHMFMVGQNRIFTPYMTVYLVISLPQIPKIHRISIYTYMYTWITAYIYTCVHGSGHLYTCCLCKDNEVTFSTIARTYV
jgi:hypothetical protein